MCGAPGIRAAQLSLTLTLSPRTGEGKKFRAGYTKLALTGRGKKDPGFFAAAALE
jgi:hypothetical protein